MCLKVNVARVCFSSVLDVLEVYLDVAKVDWDVSNVALVVHVCCKRLFQMFYLFFKRMLQVCLSGCCIVSHKHRKCFIWMLHIFFNGFSSVFRCSASVLDACFKCFKRMFQVLHLSSHVCFLRQKTVGEFPTALQFSFFIKAGKAYLQMFEE